MEHSDEFKQLCDSVKKHIHEVTVDEAKTLMTNGQNEYLIDVRDQDEYDQGHIPQAIHLSKGWIEAKIHHHVLRKDAHVILYCGGGNRSALAADNLQKMGYSNVHSMIGGYKAWVRDGDS